MGRYRGQPRGPWPPHFLWNFVLFLNNSKKICLGPLADHCSREGEQPPVSAIEHPVSSRFGLDLDQWKEKKNVVYNSATPWIKLNNLKKKLGMEFLCYKVKKALKCIKEDMGWWRLPLCIYIHVWAPYFQFNIHAMRYDGWFFVVVVAFFSFAKREIFSRKQVSIRIVPVYIKDIT